MQATYPLFVSSTSRVVSDLGRICRPLEAQMRDADTAGRVMDREVRARSAEGDLYVKADAPSRFPNQDSRLRHRQAAWDITRAALRTDIGRTFCAEAPRMVDAAWVASGMPPRGQPVTLRQVVRLARLIDYLYAFKQPTICDGRPARYVEACQKFAAALGLYAAGRETDMPRTAAESESRQMVLPTVASRAWDLMQQTDPQGRAEAIRRAAREFGPLRPAPPVPAELSPSDFETSLRPERKYG